jgi:hypothetical protein
MTQELEFIITITLVFLAFIFWISTKTNKSSPKDTTNSRILDTLDLIAEDIQELKVSKKQKRQPNVKLKNDEIIDTLEWMLSNSIITPQEYTKLMGKCLQYM